MAFFEIQNFKMGLDTRRSELTSQPGTLEVLQNAHINQGGEIEKRKAFVATPLPAGTYGFEPLLTSIVVFGSITAPAMPTGFTYQQLIHPYATGAGAVMTAIVGSSHYSGNTFAIALFADGNEFCYYNGLVVPDTYAGLITSALTTDPLIAANILALAIAAGYTGTHVTGSSQVDVVGPAGTTYSTSVVEDSTAGILTPLISNNGLAPIHGNQASGSFQIVAGTNKNGVNLVADVNIVSATTGTLVATLLTGVVNFQQDTYSTAIAVANNISANAGTSGYYAIANSNTVTIYNLTNTGTVNTDNIVVTTNGNVCIGMCAITFSGDSTVGIAGITIGSNNVIGTTMGVTSVERPNATSAYYVTNTSSGLKVGSVVTMTGFTDTTYNATTAAVTSIGTGGYVFSLGNTTGVDVRTIASYSRSRTSNVATISTGSVNHGLQVGSKITMTTGAGTGYAISVGTVTAVTTTAPYTFSYGSTGSAEGVTLDATMVCTVPKLVTAGTEIQTSTAGVPGTDTIPDLVTLAAAAISNGYTACAIGNTLYISNVVTSSADLPQTVTVTPNTGLIVGAGTVAPLTVGIVPSSLSGTFSNIGTVANPVQGLITSAATVSLSGLASAPYTYQWILQSLTYIGMGKHYVLTINNSTASSTTFRIYNAFSNTQGLSGQGTFSLICNVTDTNGLVTSSSPLMIIANGSGTAASGVTGTITY
jgi:hypothetical protein